MSRIGKLPITLPDGVTIKLDDKVVTVTGPLGTLKRTIENSAVDVHIEGNVVTLTRQNDDKETRAAHGLYRALIANMVTGVKEGFKKTIIANGVGYRITKTGNKLVMNIGYSKPKEVTEIDGITLSCTDDNKVIVSGIDKELVGQVASKIRSLRPVEPYHLYGFRYDDEVVIKKVGKKVGKK